MLLPMHVVYIYIYVVTDSTNVHNNVSVKSHYTVNNRWPEVQIARKLKVDNL